MPDISLPELALSVRQPWAWAIIHADKDIENRSWQDWNPCLKVRGRICIHAAKGMTQDEYHDARWSIDRVGWTCPDAFALRRAGIIGTVEVVDVVKEHDSPWFFGRYGLVLADPEPCDFIPCVGQLGYFKWKKASNDIVPKPAKWMMPKTPELKQTIMKTKPKPSPMPLFDKSE